jgi:hypothetical protein
MKRTPTRSSNAFAVCIRNEGYSAALERRKIYRVLPDAQAAKQALVRIVDESGEDYLYPRSYFVRLRLPQTVVDALSRPS